MKGYKVALSQWKDKDFRDFVAQQRFLQDLKNIEHEITILQEKHALLTQTGPCTYSTKVYTKKQLHNLLRWEDICPILKNYRTLKPEKNRRMKAALRFFGEFMS